MKNFSVNTADFDSLSISGESPIVQSDLGTAPNQIPLNKDLGSLAYMNAPQIEDLNVDALELREIAAEMSDTAVDVFVYDTRRDSDGGAWRNRIQHTSWYNEELNTATRGGRREFPAVAVIVAEAGGAVEGESVDFTIYDGDDPDLSMWMQYRFSIAGGTTNNTAVTALNGKIVLTARDNGILISDFIGDSMYIHNHAARHEYFNIYPSRLGRTSVSYVTDADYTIVDQRVNDVAMTVLPNAPIDSNTGLPVPTIAVATDGGVSVIRDDGSVVDSSNSVAFDRVSFKESVLYATRGTNIETWSFDSYAADEFTGKVYHVGSIPTSLGGQNNAHSVEGDNLEMGSANGLGRIYENKTNLNEGMIAYTTSSYNTGWMPGDIKLATLSDTKNEKVGVDETTELVTNGGFDSDSDWTKGTGWAINGGIATKTGGDNTSILQDIDTIAGKNYVVSLDIVSGTGNSGAKLYVGGVLVLGDLKDAQSISVDFVATDDSTEIAINGGSFDGGSIDNISVKQTGELITNGTFDNGTEGWSSVLNATLSNDANRIKVDGTSNFATALQSITGLVSGKKYTISLELIAGTSTKPYFTTNNTGGANQISNNFDFGFQSHTFTSNGETLELRLVNSSEGSGYAFFDNVSVRLAEEDRSVNDNGLQIFGQIDKTPVAPGADLVAYSGFSAENYLVQPYNPDLDFGTGDFSIMGWFQFSSLPSGLQFLFNKFNSSNAYYRIVADDLNGGRMLFQIDIDGNPNTSPETSLIFQQGLITLNWNQLVVSRKNGEITIYINGEEYIPDSGSIGSVSYSDFSIGGNVVIGGVPGVDDYKFNGRLALWRVSATAPTPEQIAKIYRDEKVLFQDGAQSTLYGTSDAVTALAYDDSDDLLHVGTASGRSTFNGLKRVDNTTTAVSTAISATEGLVIEQ